MVCQGLCTPRSPCLHDKRQGQFCSSRSPHQPGLISSPTQGGSYLSGDLPGQHSLSSVPPSERLTLLPGFPGQQGAGRGAYSQPRSLALSCLEALCPQGVTAVCDRWTGPSEGQGLVQGPAAWHRLEVTRVYASVGGGRTHSDRSLCPPHPLRNTAWRCESWEAQGFWDSFFFKIILFIFGHGGSLSLLGLFSSCD